jgi:hypothetical protein
MEMEKHHSRRIAALVFLASTLLTTYTLNQLNYTQILSLTGAIFTGSITAGIWLETSYRFLVKEATAPLDKLVEKL